MKILLFVIIGIVFASCSALKRETFESNIHRFTYISDSVQEVSIAGSFNNWTANKDVLEQNDDGEWFIDLDLEPGFYYYKFVVDGSWIPDPNNDKKINDGGTSFNSIIKIGTTPIPKRTISEEAFPRDELPEPILENNPEWVEMYYKAWELAWHKIGKGTAENGFEPRYMDEGFNELIYQWDLCFIASFGMYGRNIFPVMPSLDNFYKKQREDGYIQRVYWETDGTLAHEPTKEEPMLNPPLFAWVEWRYYSISGDISRFSRVLPHLVDYFNWIDRNTKSVTNENLYYITELGSGMDNTPRPNVGKAAWIDFSAQQALAALYITKIAAEIEAHTISEKFQNKYNSIKQAINKQLWNSEKGFYFDMTESDTLSNIQHIGSFWTLLAEVSSDDKNDQLVTALTDTSKFWRPHLVPSLAADQAAYDPKGHYWLGGVWAPTNYMLVAGLRKNGFYNLSDSVALNHIENLSDIFHSFSPEEYKIAYEERYADGYKTLWECYSPEYNEPATRWDNTFYSRQDFVGWTGLGPIAMLIENVLGLTVDGKNNTIHWNIKRNDKHGINRIQLVDQKVDLLFDPYAANPSITVKSEKPFTLSLLFKGKNLTFQLSKSVTIIEL
jgi:hypothetical protein